MVAIQHRLGAQIGEVGARVGLGIALAPDMLAGEDFRQEIRLLLLRAAEEDRVGPEEGREHARRDPQVDRRHLRRDPVDVVRAATETPVSLLDEEKVEADPGGVVEVPHHLDRELVLVIQLEEDLGLQRVRRVVAEGLKDRVERFFVQSRHEYPSKTPVLAA